MSAVDLVEFVRLTRQALRDLPDLLAVRMAGWVRDLHHPIAEDIPVCSACRKPWPCPDRLRAEQDVAP